MAWSLKLSDVISMEKKEDDKLRITTKFVPIEILVDDQERLNELIKGLQSLKIKPKKEQKEEVTLPKFYKTKNEERN